MIFRARNSGYRWVIFNENENTVHCLLECWFNNKYKLEYIGPFNEFESTSTHTLVVTTYVNGIKGGSSKTGTLYFEFNGSLKKPVAVGGEPHFSRMRDDFYSWFGEKYPQKTLGRNQSEQACLDPPIEINLS